MIPAVDMDDSDEACWCMKVPLARPETCPMMRSALKHSMSL